ncbi:hypothetical protein [Streptomyces sp. NBC_01443]|nr:hypothetical protein [Streptomyces sp. NBC_01443]MCX4625214.1 hypothetical protein [Streptomyces sp. NBC_01443]
MVPPGTATGAAREAMAQAVRADNITRASQILIAPASATDAPGRSD